MKNIKKYFNFALLSMAVLVGTTTQASLRKISRIAATKTQTALSTVKSNVSALQAGAAATALAATGTAAASGVNLPAIASAASMIDPTIAAFGAGVAAGANYIGSIQSSFLHEYQQQELAMQKAIVSPETAKASSTKEFIKFISPKTPAQLKNIIDKVQDDLGGLIITENFIKNKLLPATAVGFAPLVAGKAIAGAAFVDGMNCGMGSIIAYSWYSLAKRLQQDAAANTEPETAFDLLREHQIADQILESTNDKTLQFFTRDVSTPTNQNK